MIAPILRMAILLWVLSLPVAPLCMANEKSSDDELSSRTRYEKVVPRPHEFIESFRYVSYLYVLSTAAYLYISKDEVFNNATFQNYFRNFGNMSLFDQDLPGSNWGMHFITGALSFEFYRARSYSLIDAFMLTFLQECLFQFTVETLIQPTGLENVVNTSVIGSILGRGMEVASLPLLNSDFFLFRGLGYILNIPALFGLYESTVQVLPVIEKGATGVALQVRF